MTVKLPTIVYNTLMSEGLIDEYLDILNSNLNVFSNPSKTNDNLFIKLNKYENDNVFIFFKEYKRILENKFLHDYSLYIDLVYDVDYHKDKSNYESIINLKNKIKDKQTQSYKQNNVQIEF